MRQAGQHQLLNMESVPSSGNKTWFFETDQLWTRDNQGRNGYCVFVCPTTFLGTGGCDYGPTVRLVKGDIVET